LDPDVAGEEEDKADAEAEEVRGCSDLDCAYSTDDGVTYVADGGGLGGASVEGEGVFEFGDAEGESLDGLKDIKLLKGEDEDEVGGGSDFEMSELGATNPDGLEFVEPARFLVIFCPITERVEGPETEAEREACVGN